MGRIYHRSWRRRKVLALSLGAGVATALVLPAFGPDGEVDAGAAAEGGAPATDDMNQRTAEWVRPHDAECVPGGGLITCDRRARRHRIVPRIDRRRVRRSFAAER